jgi:hypothetical protein
MLVLWISFVLHVFHHFDLVSLDLSSSCLFLWSGAMPSAGQAHQGDASLATDFIFIAAHFLVLVHLPDFGFHADFP